MAGVENELNPDCSPLCGCCGGGPVTFSGVFEGEEGPPMLICEECSHGAEGDGVTWTRIAEHPRAAVQSLFEADRG